MAEQNPTSVNIDWTADPNFAFDTEVDALMTLETLGWELTSAREQVRQVMRYMTAAVKAARDCGEGPVSKQAIIGHSGLARQTLYDMLADDPMETESVTKP